MCWLYSVTNLLVIQQLETLYLGGNNVRVVCERVWLIQVCVQLRAFSWLELASDLRLMTRQSAICVKHAESWRVMIAGSLQDKKYSLAFLLVGDWNSWLIPVTSHSPKPLVLLKNDFLHSFSYPTINTLIPTKCWEFPERILREKPQRTTRLIHSQSYTFDSLNSSTLTLSINIPLREALAKSLSHHIHINEKIIWCLGSSSERTNSFG